MKRITSFYLFFSIISISFLIPEESSSDLKNKIKSEEQEKKNTRSEIETIKNEIKNNDIRSIETKNKLKAIDKQIKLVEKLLQKIKEQEKIINSSIVSTEINIKEKEETMENLRNQYSDMIIYLYKTHSDGYLDILLNSNSWNDIIYKMKYLEIISEKEEEIRDKLNSSITKLNEEIIKFVDELSTTSDEKSNKKNKVYVLNKDKKKERKEINKTKKRGENLQKKQFKKEKALEEIKKRLERLYLDKDLAEQREEEIRKEREEELKKIKEEKERKKKIISQRFANNKGNLLWPVKGEITERFGMYSIPQEVGPPIVGENNYISIKTEKNAKVKLPFDGIIEAIEIKDYHGSIIYINHGDGYYTVYTNLDRNIPVNIGDYCNKETFIGNTLDSEDGENGELNFRIWRVDKNNIQNVEHLNPEDWIE